MRARARTEPVWCVLTHLLSRPPRRNRRQRGLGGPYPRVWTGPALEISLVLRSCDFPNNWTCVFAAVRSPRRQPWWIRTTLGKNPTSRAEEHTSELQSLLRLS